MLLVKLEQDYQPASQANPTSAMKHETGGTLNMALKEILADPSISSWLKDAIKTAYEQDPVEALRDAHRLLKMLGERYTQVVNRDLAH